MRKLLFYTLLACVGLLGLSHGTAWGLDPNRPIKQFHHTAWNESDGLSGFAYALAQTEDGFLWIGTSSGLYRFDGLRFELYQQPDQTQQIADVRSLLATKDGGLWVGYRTGVAFIQPGKAKTFTERDGLPYGRVRGLAQTRDGVIWASVVGGLARYADGHWKRIRSEWNYQDKTAQRVVIDNAGTLWVSGNSTVRYLKEGEHAFHETGLAVGNVTFLKRGPQGAVWICDFNKKEIVQVTLDLTSNKVQIQARIPSASYDALIDREGSLWFSGESGIYRLAAAAFNTKSKPVKSSLNPDRLLASEGLSGQLPFSLLEDREGNIWVGTESGLDRFRARTVTQKDLGFTPSRLVVGPHSEVWAMPDHADFLTPVQGGGPVRIPRFEVEAVFMDRAGAVWASMQSSESAGSWGLWKMLSGNTVKITPPPQVPAPYIKGIVADPQGKLWFTISGDGEFTLDNGKWSRIPVFQGKDADISPDAQFTDAQGRAWLVYYARNTVVMVDREKITFFTIGHGLDLGSPIVGWARGDQVWVSGTRGVAIFDGRRFRNLHGTDGNTFENVSAIIPTDHDGLWLKAPTGVIHIPQDDVEAFLRDPNHKVQHRTFDGATDFKAQLTRDVPSPSGTDAAQSGDGKLWFTTQGGVGMIDPAHLAKNDVPPPVFIRSVTADGKEYSAHQAISLPKSTRDLSVDYTALSLTFPERNRFRYQLVGFDKEWQDAETRRQAFYTNLPPGRYLFRVIAANNDGVWNMTGASVSMVISPTFVQTILFRILCAAFAMLGIAFLIWWRTQQIELQARNELSQRLAERSRIARDLHDTLLQGFQGLLLRFQAAASSIPEDAPAYGMMQGALLRADDVLAEGRDRVRDLRIQEMQTLSLAERLRKVADELNVDGITEIRLTVAGEPRPLHRVVHEEGCLILREALTNAFLHSGSKAIRIELVYTTRRLVIRIEDDGVGIDPDILVTGKRDHFGLSGMRERAQQIKSNLRVRSKQGVGTVVELMIPARIAYSSRRAGPFVRWLPKKR